MSLRREGAAVRFALSVMKCIGVCLSEPLGCKRPRGLAPDERVSAVFPELDGPKRSQRLRHIKTIDLPW